MANEKRLIDFEKARKKVMEILAGKISTPVAVKVSLAMQDATVDAVEVVRCKDCKWRNTKGCPYMNFNAAAREDEDYCSDGERKGNERKAD